MPRRPRPGDWAIIYAEVTPDAKARLEQAAKKDGRSLSSFLGQWLQTLPPVEDAKAAPKERKKKP